MDGEDDAVLTVAVLFPDLLGTYGDGGNATALVARARARGVDVEVLEVTIGSVLPAASIYLLGGAEDGPQRLACDLLAENGFVQRVDEGAFVFAVCAGLQILGTSFSIEGDASYSGLGLVDAVTTRGAQRSVGDLATMVDGRLLVGFENHGGVTVLASGLEALGDVVHGRGNDGRLDGYRAPRLWATYAHGPVLAQNPWLADEVLQDVLGRELAPWPSVADRLYAERCERISTRRPDDGRTRRHH